ncbi:MAG TPA: hypothetical protein VEC35_10730 [Noviherbaspirillum sp.]|nr:hypothetical protein [Noviherbaspirillum sp.]
MFNKAMDNLPLPDRKLRYAVAVRIALVLLAFFSVAWSLLQWTLATEPRFMVEGITRQFVVIEAIACAVVAALAFVLMVANGLGWLATVAKMRREQRGAARSLATKHSVQRISAYI